MAQQTLNITPDKSLMRKLGSTGYTTIEAIAELVDNSVDARTGNCLVVKIDVDMMNNSIKVYDDGIGMDVAALESAMTLAKEKTRKNDSLGKFGLGLKSACSTLGKKFQITTSTSESNSSFTVNYDEEEWERESDLNWKKFPYKTQSKLHADNHGTKITILDLKIPIYYGMVSRLLDNFSLRYADYIKQKQVKIYVNKKPCNVKEIEIEKDTATTFSISHKGNNIPVKIALLKKRSIKGEYGFHLYYKDRLIRAYSKFGIKTHPTVAKTIGSIRLDHVPLNYHKTNFITTSAEYKELEKIIEKHPVIKKYMDMQSTTSVPNEMIKQICEYLMGNTHDVPKLDIRSNSYSRIKKIINMLPDMHFTHKGNTIDISFSDSKNLYGITAHKNSINIQIGKESPVFKTTKNPFYILFLIMSEIRSILDSNSVQNIIQFINQRNSSWSDFITASDVKTPVKVKHSDYTISPKLQNLYNDISEKSEKKFEFTALSTLEQFCNYVMRIPIYSIYAENSGGQHIFDIIRDSHSEYSVLLNPSPDSLQAVLNTNPSKKCIIIREFTKSELNQGIATPAKAWVDLWREKHRYTIPISDEDIYESLSQLADKKIVTENSIEKLMQRRNIKTTAIIKEIFAT